MCKADLQSKVVSGLRFMGELPVEFWSHPDKILFAGALGKVVSEP